MKTFLSFAFVGFLVWLYFYLSIANYHPKYVYSTPQILPVPSEKTIKSSENPIKSSEIAILLQQINEKTSQIQSFMCDDVQMQMKNFNVTGTLAYEKEKRFRLIINSFLSKEMDIGSNDTYFWFWSNQMNPPTLRYVRHEQIKLAKLKTPLNPDWLIESINLGVINTDNVISEKFADHYRITQPKTSLNGEQIKSVKIIDPTRLVITGHYLYDQQNKLIASSEIKSFQLISNQRLPRSLVITWSEENIQFNWTLANPKINININKTNWVMPTMKNSINMVK